MTLATSLSLLQHLRRLWRDPEGEESDARLLERYVARRDEEAFAQLLARHGGMVLQLARRLLGKEQDAEDLFQAVFLLLAQKAGTLRQKQAVAGWLYTTAFRLSLRLRAQSQRRREGELAGEPMTTATDDPIRDAAWQELRGFLDHELHRLPEMYRTPLLLCYFEGLTTEQAARRLDVPVGTLRTRAARGREKLRRRLTKRGMVLTSSALATALAAVPAPAAVAERLTTPLLTAATTQLTPAVSERVTALVREGLSLVASGGSRLLGFTVLVLGSLIAGVTAAMLPGGSSATQELPPTKQPPVIDEQAPPAVAEAPLVLPPGAVGRLDAPGLSIPGTFYFSVFTPDGKALATARADGTVRLVDVATGREVQMLGKPAEQELRPDQYWVSWLAFSQDGKRLAVLKKTKEVIIWDMQTAQEIKRLPAELYDQVSSLAFAPDGKSLLVGAGRNPPVVWDIESGKEAMRLSGHTGGAAAVAWSHDGELLATGGDDQTLRLWGADGKHVRTLTGHRNTIRALAFAPDSKRVASAAEDGTVIVWDAATGARVHDLNYTGGFVNSDATTAVIGSLAFTPDGKTLVLARTDRSVRFWDTATGMEQARFEGDGTFATNVAVSPDGRLVSHGNTGKSEGRLHLWDRFTGKELEPGGSHAQPVAALAWSHDGAILATGSLDRTIRLWDARTRRLLHKFEGHRGAVTHLAISSDSKLIASACRHSLDRNITLWNLDTGTEYRQLRLINGDPAFRGLPGERMYGRGFDFFAIDFSPAGRDLVALDASGYVCVWDVPSGELKSVRNLNARSIKFAHGGRLLLLDRNNQISLIDLATWNVKPLALAIPTHPTKQIGVMAPQVQHVHAITPDDRFVITTTMNEDFQLWSVATWDLIRTFRGPFNWARDKSNVRPPLISLTPDGRSLVVNLNDNSIRLYELATGLERKRVAEKSREVMALALSPRGDMLVSAAVDTSVLFWSLHANDDKPLTPDDAARLWNQLQDKDAARAYDAVLRLSAAPGTAFAPFRQHFALAHRQRLAELLGKQPAATPTPQQLQVTRALETLANMATPEARNLLAELAAGTDEFLLAREARSALAIAQRNMPLSPRAEK